MNEIHYINMTSEDSYNLQKNQDLHSEETKEICIRPSLEMDMTKEFSPRTVRYTSA